MLDVARIEGDRSGAGIVIHRRRSDWSETKAVSFVGFQKDREPLVGVEPPPGDFVDQHVEDGVPRGSLKRGDDRALVEIAAAELNRAGAHCDAGLKRQSILRPVTAFEIVKNLCPGAPKPGGGISVGAGDRSLDVALDGGLDADLGTVLILVEPLAAKAADLAGGRPPRAVSAAHAAIAAGGERREAAPSVEEPETGEDRRRASAFLRIRLRD